LKKAVALILVILLIDQVSKIYIKTNFTIGESIHVLGLDWFQIYFVQNSGMAWGFEFGGRKGKFFLTTFRLIAVTGIGYWLYIAHKNKSHKILLVAISFIFAGALGNIIDSLFYGLIFDDPQHKVATLFAADNYDTLFHGKVVDMFYLPFIKDAVFPSWIPYFGGKHFTFFNAIFNVADTAISIGVLLMVLFNKKVFPKEETQAEVNSVEKAQ
jgi:signal peptidase II